MNLIKNFIKKLKNHQKILLSYSGGLDSTVLLYQMINFTKKPPFLKIRTVHINHQKNPLSNFWSTHCYNTCKSFKIPCLIKKINIHYDKNFQKKARTIRYRIIQKYILPQEILVTGHQLDDQCENLFLSLKRNRGIVGICGMKKETSIHNYKIAKPLLQYTKQTLKKWAKLNNIQWIQDNSNFTNQYDRNFIRNEIIKKIKKKWPFFIKNCVKSMNICKMQEKSLNEFLDDLINKNSIYKNCLNILHLKKFFKSTQILLIRRWISLYTKIVMSYKQTKELYNKIINTNNKHTKYKIFYKTYIIQRYKNNLFQNHKLKSIKNKIFFWHNYNIPLTLPEKMGYIISQKNGIKIPKPKKTELVNIRFQCNKKILINQKYKKIKNIWQENQIPYWYRNYIPCIFYNNTLISILGIRPNNQYFKKRKLWEISWVYFI